MPLSLYAICTSELPPCFLLQDKLQIKFFLIFEIYRYYYIIQMHFWLFKLSVLYLKIKKEFGQNPKLTRSGGRYGLYI